MNPALRHSAAHLFVTSLEVPQPDDLDAHHLFRVLRLRDGESVTVSDGAGSWRPTVVAGHSLLPAGDIEFVPAGQQVAIATAIPKGDRLEWMVQKLTEVGVAEIVFLHCERSVVRWSGDRAAKQLERQRRVAREAASQSRRVWLPHLSGPVTYADAAAAEGVVVADPSGDPFVRTAGPIMVVVGPEGGLTTQELRSAVSIRRWGANVLRVETAAVVIAASFLI